eukprot:4533279-Prymnesium_polylepis.1
MAFVRIRAPNPNPNPAPAHVPCPRGEAHGAARRSPPPPCIAAPQSPTRLASLGNVASFARTEYSSSEEPFDL